MISGHTAQSSGKVLTLCGNSYIGIDVGITAYYGKLVLLFVSFLAFIHFFMYQLLPFLSDTFIINLQLLIGANRAALEIIENKDGTQTVSAIYPSGKVILS